MLVGWPGAWIARFAGIAMLAGALGGGPVSAFGQQGAAAAEVAPSGPIRLRQAGPEAGRPIVVAPDVAPRPAARASGKPSDFELFVRRVAGQSGQDSGSIKRLGAELMVDVDDETQGGLPKVPADYVVAAGDELFITIWGSVDADLRVVVDRAGQISIPRVGSIPVAGVRFTELTPLISKRVARVFRNFELSVALGKIRQIRVYVTGFVDKPGAYSVSGLGTIVNALIRAGGPAAAGSFRSIQLRRGGQAITTYDLYDLLVKGDNSADRTLQAEDVIHVNAVGTQVGVIGSVNRPGVLELKPGETIEDMLKMAGGLTAVADRSRMAIERLDDRNDIRIVQVALPGGLSARLSTGDVVRVFSAVDATLPVDRQNKRVRVEGEVARPGEYVLPAGSAVEDAIRAAGGLTDSAYVFGTEFNRESVRRTQAENYERAIRDLETELARAVTTQRTTTADEAAAASARGQSTTRLVERLRAISPNGRVVLQLDPETGNLPNLALEDGDRIYVPSRPTTVGVFGSVFNGGSYLHARDRRIGDFLRLAGGPTRGADADSVFVIRANGSVVSDRQRKTSFFSTSRDVALADLPALPGDTVFVPEEMDKSTFTQKLKDWTQILSQFGLGLAAIKTLSN